MSSKFSHAFFHFRHPFLSKCMLRMCKRRKPDPNFLWLTKVSEAVCKHDWHNVRVVFIFQRAKISDENCAVTLSLHVLHVSVWMKGAVSPDTQTQTRNAQHDFSIWELRLNIWEHEHMYFISRAALRVTSQALLCFIWENNCQIHTDTESITERPSQHPVKIKVWFNLRKLWQKYITIIY